MDKVQLLQRCMAQIDELNQELEKSHSTTKKQALRIDELEDRVQILKEEKRQLKGQKSTNDQSQHHLIVENQRLKLELQAMSDKVKKVQQENTCYQEAFEVKESKNIELEQANEELQKQIVEKNLYLETIETTIEQISRKTQLLGDEKHENEERQQRLCNQLKALEEEHKGVLQHYQQSKVLLGEQQQETERWRQQADHQKRLNIDLQKQVEQMGTELEKDLLAMDNKREDNQLMVKSLERQLLIMQQQLQDKESQIGRDKERETKLTQEVHEIQREQEETIRKYELKLEGLMGQYELRMQQCIRDRDTHAKAAAESKDKVDCLLEENAACKHKVEQQHMKLEEFQREALGLQEQMQGVFLKEQEEKEEQAQRIDQQHQVITQLEEDLRRAVHENNQLTMQKSQEQTQLATQVQLTSQIENEAEEAKSQLASVKKQKKQLEKALQEKFNDIQHEIQEEKGKRARLKHKYLQLQQELVESKHSRAHTEVGSHRRAKQSTYDFYQGREREGQGLSQFKSVITNMERRLESIRRESDSD